MWNDEQCSSCYTLSLIGQYLDKIVTKCNRAFSCVFMKVLALLWCGRQFPEIISSFFSSLLEIWASFLPPLIARAGLCVSLTRKWNLKRMLSLYSRSWGL
jgi:hypothetical protein